MRNAVLACLCLATAATIACTESSGGTVLSATATARPSGLQSASTAEALLADASGIDSVTFVNFDDAEQRLGWRSLEIFRLSVEPLRLDDRFIEDGRRTPRDGSAYFIRETGADHISYTEGVSPLTAEFSGGATTMVGALAVVITEHSHNWTREFLTGASAQGTPGIGVASAAHSR